jgi:hypothetical protein
MRIDFILGAILVVIAFLSGLSSLQSISVFFFALAPDSDLPISEILRYWPIWIRLPRPLKKYLHWDIKFAKSTFNPFKFD